MTRHELIENIMEVRRLNEHIKFNRIHFEFNDIISKCLTKFGKVDEDYSLCMLSAHRTEYLYKGYLLLKYITDEKFMNEVDARNPYLCEMESEIYNYPKALYYTDFTKFEQKYEELHQETEDQRKQKDRNRST